MHTTGGVPNEKISVIYASVDVNRFNPAIKTDITRAQLGINNDAFVIGYTGSIGGRKGIDIFIDAVKHIIKVRSNVVLLLVGITDEQLRVHGINIEPEFKPAIKCVGFQYHPEYYMALFDLFVFPGTKSEGLTGAIREAAAMNIPVVTTDVGGTKELIKNNERGLVVSPKNSVALTTAVHWMIDNYDQACEMALKAYDFVHAHMTLEIRTKQVLSLLSMFYLGQGFAK